MDTGDRIWEGCGDVEVGGPTENHFFRCRTGFSQLHLTCTHLYNMGGGAQAEGGSHLNIMWGCLKMIREQCGVVQLISDGCVKA